MEGMSSVMGPFSPSFYLYYLYFLIYFWVQGFMFTLFIIVFLYIWYFEEAIVRPLSRGFFLFVLFDLHGNV